MKYSIRVIVATISGLIKTFSPRIRKSTSIASVLIGVGVLAVAVSAYNAGHFVVSSATPSRIAVMPQVSNVLQTNLFSRLSFQPEADRLRRRLGQRFVAPGRERTLIAGTLTAGGQAQPIAITRTQNATGERVEIALSSGPAYLTWSATEGALSAGSPATGAQRALIERLVLDSPDQCVLSQTRGASYYTVSRAARPAGTGASDTYTGPVWAVVQITEPANAPVAPLSAWRLYQINVGTGLVDRVISQEQQGQDLTAEL